MAVKLGTPHVYVLWGAGVTNGDRSRKGTLLVAQAGLGGHITPWGESVFIDVDLVATRMSSSEDWVTKQDGQLASPWGCSSD